MLSLALFQTDTDDEIVVDSSAVGVRLTKMPERPVVKALNCMGSTFRGRFSRKSVLDLA